MLRCKQLCSNLQDSIVLFFFLENSTRERDHFRCIRKRREFNELILLAWFLNHSTKEVFSVLRYWYNCFPIKWLNSYNNFLIKSVACFEFILQSRSPFGTDSIRRGGNIVAICQRSLFETKKLLEMLPSA